MTTSFRDQMRHWRQRALVAEEANAKAASFVEEERKRAQGAIEAQQQHSIGTSRVLYMSGADAAGLRIRLGDLARKVGSWWWRLKAAFGIGVRGELALVEAALSGKAGDAIRGELEAAKKREIRLAAFADTVRQHVLTWRTPGADRPGSLLQVLDSEVRKLAVDMGVDLDARPDSPAPLRSDDVVEHGGPGHDTSAENVDALEQLAATDQPTCPTCGEGQDTDGDGDCSFCAGGPDTGGELVELDKRRQ